MSKGIVVKNVDAYIEMVTPKMAKEWLSNNPHNRKIKIPRSQRYAELMKKGQWSLTNEGIGIDKYGRLLDGQHRLQAIVLSETSQMMLILKGLDPDTRSKINRGRNRSITDDLNILGFKNANVLSTGLKDYVSMKMYGHTIEDRKIKYISVSILSDDIVSEYRSDWEFYDKVATLSISFNKKDNMKLFAAAEYFLMMTHLIKDKLHSMEKVTQFFTELNTQSSNFIVNKVRTDLLKALRDKKTGKGKTHEVTKEYKYRLVTAAWRAFITEDDRQKPTFTDEIEFI